MLSERADHWAGVWQEREPTEVSWFQPDAGLSLQLIAEALPDRTRSVVDVGGGASVLVDALIAAGYGDLTVVDLAEAALLRSQARLGAAAERVAWVVGDVTTWRPGRRFDLWHDRAVFHFLTDPADRVAYRATVADAVPPGGHLVIATFAEDGPDRCSGLPVCRYSAAGLANEIDPIATLVTSAEEWHGTPAKGLQHFIYAVFRRT